MRSGLLLQPGANVMILEVFLTEKMQQNGNFDSNVFYKLRKNDHVIGLQENSKFSRKKLP
jgi:hypothetical protein